MFMIPMSFVLGISLIYPSTYLPMLFWYLVKMWLSYLYFPFYQFFMFEKFMEFVVHEPTTVYGILCVCVCH